MHINYFWDELSPEVVTSDEIAIARFPRCVDAIAPGNNCKVERLDQTVTDDILSKAGTATKFDAFVADVAEILFDAAASQKLLICCSDYSTIAKLLRGACPHCKWGGNCGGLSVVYHHTPAAIWHEMLHLLGAKDCYELNPFHDCVCGQHNCLMQYAPTLSAGGDPPFVCEDNVLLVRTALLSAQAKSL